MNKKGNEMGKIFPGPKTHGDACGEVGSSLERWGVDGGVAAKNGACAFFALALGGGGIERGEW